MITECKSTSIILLTCVGLSGCQIHPDYQPPEAPVPATWNANDSESESGKIISSADAFFKDDKIRHIVYLTSEKNQDLRTSALNLRKVYALYGMQRLASLPSVNASLGQTSAHLPAGLLDTVDTGAITYHQYDAKLVSASWELDLWGRVRSLKDAALYDYLANGAQARALKLETIGQSVSAYLTLLADRNRLLLSEKKTANLKTIFAMYQASYQLGETSLEEVTLYENNLQRAAQYDAALRLSVQKEYDALQFMLGGAIPEALMSDEAFDHDWEFGNLKPGLPANILLKRPDVIAAEYRMRQANADMGAARAAFYPSITLTAEGGSSSAALKNLFSAGTAAWSFSPDITLPIFNNGRNKANLEAAELTQQAAAADYEKTLQQAFRDVSDALAGRIAQQTQYTLSAQLFSTAQKNLEMTRQSIRAGEKNKLAALEAENNLIDAEEDKITSKLQLLLQNVQLYEVLGGYTVT
ncbi:hypothetical protein CYR32_10220 [Chimaeribacter coloradensis]|uniref:RND transporter n=1 Tax=Chimaeribacter coloradensis TaxID=2060068 RepID=A0A2N5E400_9GAMM|nr:efflux transporter outer membrane subunit [Chimaeribacter coloradensis]PLR35560.1 hypothetical protein CYR32_10220 [Chimaeribacter coloradensis]